jgi:alanine-synthesizing transaminase
MKPIAKSHKLEGVCYDIRGPVMREAQRLEEEGYSILRLNIGNTMPFGFLAPDECVHDVIINLKNAQGYCDSKGLFAARKAVMQKCQQAGIRGVGVEDIYMGNGVSELIVMAMQGLLNPGDEMLVPAPDYPLWTAAVTLQGGKAVHYLCDEQSDWNPSIEDIKSKISPKTRGIVLINPNNPTGAVYPREILEQIIQLAREHELIVLADEIYDKILYDGAEHCSIASLADDVLFLTFGGLSKVYRAPGFRSGWMIVSGKTDAARDYVDGLTMLASMRLCSNVPAQYAVQTALGGYQSINDLVSADGDLTRRRDAVVNLLNDIPGVSVVKPKGALYVFPKIDLNRYRVQDDQRLVLDLLLQEKVLIVQGSGFNWTAPDHFRIVFLPAPEVLEDAVGRIGRFLQGYRQS